MRERRARVCNAPGVMGARQRRGRPERSGETAGRAGPSSTHRAEVHREDGGDVPARGARGDGRNLQEVGHGDGGERARVGRDPQVQSVERADQHLQEADRHRETRGATGCLQRVLVVERVIVVAEVPSGKVEEQRVVDAHEHRRRRGQLTVSGRRCTLRHGERRGLEAATEAQRRARSHPEQERAESGT
jgi:hypothetical protein